MKLKLDEEILMDIEVWMISLMAYDLIDPLEDIKRRLKYIIQYKCDQCFNRLEQDWMPVLREDPTVEHIPKSKRDFVNLVISRADYKNRLQKELSSIT